jgi:pyruvate dehydrogenase E1 component alpha subunit
MKHPPIAAVVLLREDGAALMQLRDDKPGLARANMWVIPGGHQDPDEDNLTAARRELKEETDYDCPDLRYLNTYDDANDVTGQNYKLTVFWGRYDGRQTLRCLEGQALRFMSRAEALEAKVPEVVVRAWDFALVASRETINHWNRNESEIELMPTITHESLLKGQGCTKPNLGGIDQEMAHKLYRSMTRLRRMEMALYKEYHPADEMRCPVHFCIGQEAVSASLSQLLRPKDYVFSHHRSHGYFMGKNAPMKALFAELYGRETGANGGRAGSQDISYAAANFYSGAILAGAVAIATGAAYGEQYRGTDNIAVTGFGEACTDEGVFWEAISFAGLNQLPMVFVCENNRYSTFSPQLDRQVSDNLTERVAAFGVQGESIFGNDVVTVYKTLEKAVAKARAGKGPTFVQAYTYRWNGHVGATGDETQGYRTTEEVDYWKGMCPIKLMEEALVGKGWLDDAKKTKWIAAIDQEIAEAFEFAKSSPFPSDADWQSLNYATATPEADRLLHDVEGGGFNQYQAEAIPGPY